MTSLSYTKRMKVTVSVSQTVVHPKRFECIACASDGSLYPGPSGSWGSSRQAVDEAQSLFKGLEMNYTHPAIEKLGEPLYQGHVFVAEPTEL